MIKIKERVVNISWSVRSYMSYTWAAGIAHILQVTSGGHRVPRVSNVGERVADAGFRVSGAGERVAVTGFRVSGSEPRVAGVSKLDKPKDNHYVLPRTWHSVGGAPKCKYSDANQGKDWR